MLRIGAERNVVAFEQLHQITDLYAIVFLNLLDVFFHAEGVNG